MYIGTTLDSTSKIKNKFIPQELFFPSVAVQLNWSTLVILDWLDIDSQSPEYNFLKEIGVRETPDLSVLIDRIIDEHNYRHRQQRKITMSEYKLPSGLIFLASHFHQYYRKQWSPTMSEKPFLPSYYPTTFDENSDANDIKVELLAPCNVVTGLFLYISTSFFFSYYDLLLDENPFFAIPIPEVIQLFINHCDISLIGVKQRPTLITAFHILINRKSEILTAQSAPKLFSYLNTLDGLNNATIDQIIQYAFIPLPGSLILNPTTTYLYIN